MPSPFPGVDPFIEDQHYWPDFHHRFMNYLCEAVADRLPPRYEARLEEWIRFIEREVKPRKNVREPDIAVERRRSVRTKTPATIAAPKLIIQPVNVELPAVDEYREIRIQILHRPGRQLVTVLEVLSPENKYGAGREAYLEKRSEVLLHAPPIHLVELDMLLRGLRLPMRQPLPPGDFYAFVSRAEQRPQAQVYVWSVRQPLPTVAVPLKAPDPDVVIDLAAVFATAFDRGHYDQSIDYAKRLRVPLAAEDLRWAMRQAKTRKRRS
jgi:hypothetical protein